MRDQDETLDAPGLTRASEAGSITSLHTKGPSVVPGGDYDDLVIVDPAHYAILKELARGGMGRILEARDRRLGRRVAIKEVLQHDEGSLSRFEREARITARLQHPSIVHVHEAGRWPTGQPFYAMKLIRGKPLDERIGAAGSLAKRLELIPAVIAVVDALAFAHSEQVIHRDLKPANVLVGDFGETVVIDWGIAKDLTTSDADDVTIGPYPEAAREGETVEGAIMGTPAYMPPEQAAGERVDARADVYALGALLYQVLAGAPPYAGRTTAAVLDCVLEGPPPPLAEREPEAPADLIAIVEKAMARDPANRFPTANEMVAELKRFQTGQLVTSRRYTKWELVKRWVQRYRAAVGVAAVAFGTLAVLAVLGIAKIIDERNRADAEAASSRASADEGRIAQARTALDSDPSLALAFLKQLGPGASKWRQARMIASDAASRGVAHVYTGGRESQHLVFTHDGQVVAYESDRGMARIWDPATYLDRQIYVGELEDLIATGGDLLGITPDGRVFRWSLATGVIRPVRTIPGEFRSATLSPDGRRVALYARSTIRIVDLQTAGEQTHAYRWGSWSPDGSKFVALDNTNAIWWLDPSSGATTQIPGPPAYTSRVVTDGARVWASKRDDTAAHDEGSPWRMITELTTKYEQRFPAPVGILAPYLHGRIASTSATMTTISETLQGQIRGRRVRIDPDSIFASDNAITISDGTSAIIQLRGQMQIHTLATDRAGRIASADQDGTIRIWRPPFVTRRHGDGKSTTSAATLTADRRELVMTRLGPALEVQTLDTGALRRIDVTAFPDGFTPTTYEWAERITQVGNMRFSERTEGNNDEILVLVGSASGRKLASIDERQHLMVWDLDASTGRMLAEGALHVAISSDGSRVVSAHQDRTLKVWELSTNKPVQLGSSMQVSALAFGPDRAIAVATLGGNIYTFDARHKARKIAEQGEVNRALAYTPDGKTLVAGGDRWYLRTWQLDTLATRKLIGHSGTVTALTVADDGRVASTSADLTVRVWNLATGSSSVLRGHTGLVTSVVFGADDMLVTASEDRTARVWDLRSRESRSLTGHADTVLFASHLPGEQQLLVVDRFRQIAVYPDNLPHDEMLLRLWLETATNLTN